MPWKLLATASAPNQQAVKSDDQTERGDEWPRALRGTFGERRMIARRQAGSIPAPQASARRGSCPASLQPDSSRRSDRFRRTISTITRNSHTASPPNGVAARTSGLVANSAPTSHQDTARAPPQCACDLESGRNHSPYRPHPQVANAAPFGSEPAYSHNSALYSSAKTTKSASSTKPSLLKSAMHVGATPRPFSVTNFVPALV